LKEQKDQSVLVFGGYDKKYAPATNSALAWSDNASSVWSMTAEEFSFGDISDKITAPIVFSSVLPSIGFPAE
jgi:hypothetical protein